jgi:hypothetical protein
MLSRPTLTRPVQGDASKPKGQARPTEERFLLRVDGQVKRSFTSKEDAVSAGAVIKKACLRLYEAGLTTIAHAATKRELVPSKALAISSSRAFCLRSRSAIWPGFSTIFFRFNGCQPICAIAMPIDWKL